jgi:hypothetical protein
MIYFHTCISAYTECKDTIVMPRESRESSEKRLSPIKATESSELCLILLLSELDVAVGFERTVVSVRTERKEVR